MDKVKLRIYFQTWEKHDLMLHIVKDMKKITIFAQNMSISKK